MWWYYRKLKEDERFIYYQYARESRETDGILRFDKQSNDPFSAQCVQESVTSLTERDRRYALGKFCYVVEDGFPETRMVAIG